MADCRSMLLYSTLLCLVLAQLPPLQVCQAHLVASYVLGFKDAIESVEVASIW